MTRNELRNTYPFHQVNPRQITRCCHPIRYARRTRWQRFVDAFARLFG